MTKVKILKDFDYIFFEDKINNFIKNKNIKDIKFAVTSHDKYALIIYEEQEQEE